jgi:hypothetical protein
MDKEIDDEQRYVETEIGYSNLNLFPHNCIGWIICTNEQGN